MRHLALLSAALASLGAFPATGPSVVAADDPFLPFDTKTAGNSGRIRCSRPSKERGRKKMAQASRRANRK